MDRIHAAKRKPNWVAVVMRCMQCGNWLVVDEVPKDHVSKMDVMCTPCGELMEPDFVLGDP